MCACVDAAVMFACIAAAAVAAATARGQPRCLLVS